MIYTQEELKNAILYFAKIYNKKQCYEELFKVNTGYSEIVKMITYDMFLNHFDFLNSTSEEYMLYRVIYMYAHELDEKGIVEYAK